jgi:hypothetical protein
VVLTRAIHAACKRPLARSGIVEFRPLPGGVAERPAYHTQQRLPIHGLTVSVVCTETAPVVAVITTGVEVETENVGTLKVVLFEPAGTLTLAGMATALLLLVLKSTIVPPVGAGLFNVTVPTVVVPAVTGFGLNESEETTGRSGLTVMVALFTTVS